MKKYVFLIVTITLLFPLNCTYAGKPVIKWECDVPVPISMLELVSQAKIGKIPGCNLSLGRTTVDECALQYGKPNDFHAVFRAHIYPELFMGFQTTDGSLEPRAIVDRLVSFSPGIQQIRIADIREYFRDTSRNVDNSSKYLYICEDNWLEINVEPLDRPGVDPHIQYIALYKDPRYWFS